MKRIRLLSRTPLSLVLAVLLTTGCGSGSGTGGGSSFVNALCTSLKRPIAGVGLEQTFPNLPAFDEPLWMGQAPGETGYWYVIEKAGTIYRFANDPSVNTRSVVLDLTTVVDSVPTEAGLLGMTFHPGFAGQSPGRIYLSYTMRNDDDLTSIISEWTSSDGGATINPASEVVLIELVQPFNNHNGGHIAFGPDDYLYIALGDGGSAGDPLDNAQDTTNLFGSILRIDVDSTTGMLNYGIPADNPFAASLTDAPEIYAWGLRNPWRFSFDMADDGTEPFFAYAGDVGQATWEEVDLIENGGNYGWNCREGAHEFESNGDNCTGTLIDPVAEYSHGEGISITGGFVYRGTAIQASPEEGLSLEGAYIFGDFGSGTIWALLNPTNPMAREMRTLFPQSGIQISSFAQDADGEIYVLDFADGTIHQLVSADADAPGSFPQMLSDTGCVDPADPTIRADGVLPYEINVPFWSDGAAKFRHFTLPAGGQITIESDGDFTFPVGTVLVKDFKLDGKFIETRLLVHHADGWAGYTYKWDDMETDATLVGPGGETVDLGTQDWLYPSRAQCLQCHTSFSGFALGPQVGQLNRDVVLGGQAGNQLEILSNLGAFDAPLPDVTANLPALPETDDTSVPVEDRARAWLHSNCSQCHRSDSTVFAVFDMRASKTFADMNICGTAASTDINGANTLLDPESTANSVIYQRINTRNGNAMPPLGSRIIDANGVALIEAWINSLGSCPTP